MYIWFGFSNKKKTHNDALLGIYTRNLKKQTQTINLSVQHGGVIDNVSYDTFIILLRSSHKFLSKRLQLSSKMLPRVASKTNKSPNIINNLTLKS